MRLLGAAGLLLFILACSSGGHGGAATIRRSATGNRRTRTGFILAKLSGAYCSESAVSPASGPATSAQSVSVLSAATIQTVTTIAAAAGLKFHKEVATPCWVLLDGDGRSPAEMAAAVSALKQPSLEVSAAATTASSEPVFVNAVEEHIRFFSAKLPQKPLRRPSKRPSNSSPHVKHPHRHNATAAMKKRRRAGGPKQMAGLPDECSSGACNTLWGMTRIKAPELWKKLVAEGKMPLPAAGFLKGTLIDAGVDFAHNDIKGQADTTNSRTFYPDNGNQPPGGKAPARESHGTHCFGTIAGNWSPYDKQADRRGIAGVVGPAYNNIVSCNVFGNRDGASDSDIAACIRHSVNVKAHYAINLSLGGPGTSAENDAFWRDTFGPFCSAGGVALIAAGNGYIINGVDRGRDVANVYADGRQHDYPAYAASFYPDCILVVAAISQGSDKLTDFSNYGQLVRIAAPGAGILSDVNSASGNPWASDVYDGTSMATPHVTGATVLLRNLFPSATNKQVVSCIVSSADRTVQPYWSGATINGGVLNVMAAYNCLAGSSVSPPPPPPFTPPPTPPPTPPSTSVDCRSPQQVTVPACVDQSSGFVNPRCTVSSSVYCLPVGGSACSYSYKSSGTVCDTATMSTCSGSLADCPASRPTAQFCSSGPPDLDDAYWDDDCYDNVPVGYSCSGWCSSYYDGIEYEGDGYTSTCQPGGIWSTPLGSCDGGGDYNLGPQCWNDCRVAYCSACSCGQDDAGNNACSCNALQGFTPWSYTFEDTGDEYSYCTWNLDAVKGYSVRARRGSSVVIEFSLMAGLNKICPKAKVITSVDFGPVEPCPSNMRPGMFLPLRAAGRQKPLTETCAAVQGQGRTLSYALQVNSPAEYSKGMCAVVTIGTSDDTVQEMLLRYLD